MQSSSTVGILGRDDGFEAQLHHHQDLYSQSRTRLHDTHSHHASHYPHSSHPSYAYPYQAQHRSPVPQSPPSPPSEDTIKPSLPSISSLLGMANGEQTSIQGQMNHQPQAQPQQPASNFSPSAEFQSPPVVHGYAPSNPSKMSLPPTPPLGPDPPNDANHSPSAASSHSSMSAPPYYLGHAMSSIDPHHQRQSLSADPLARRQSVTSQASMSPYQTSPYSTSPYPPTTASSGPYYATEHPALPPSAGAGMYGQRPLPSNFPPTVNVPIPLSEPASATAAPTANPWQHHHYIGPNSQSSFPQTQDRYVCPTCNKAFSRPSSLRIHSHSHTGEKPFKCSHAGCGKAFSVRSNMKRHERGCHAVAPNSAPATS